MNREKSHTGNLIGMFSLFDGRLGAGQSRDEAQRAYSYEFGQYAHGRLEHDEFKDASKAPYDLQFLDTMGMHHQSAVEMAKLAEDRSEHAELKAMSKKIISDQQGEISQMKSWREQWYPGKSQAMNMEMPGMMDSMKGMSMPKLAASKGKEFDSMFLDMMIKHHSGAVKMAKSAEAKAQHQEIKDLSKKMVSAQQDEIAQMKKWKVQWKLAGS